MEQEKLEIGSILSLSINGKTEQEEIVVAITENTDAKLPTRTCFLSSGVQLTETDFKKVI